jgi:uncharacterized protein YjbJ (UPF0337 family)
MVAMHSDQAADWDRIERNWSQFRGKIQHHWGRLTDGDLDLVGGRRTELAVRIQQRYGYPNDATERQIDAWLGTVV